MYIFLDESGDLGFDPKCKSASKYFTIALLVCNDARVHRAVQSAVRHTLKKINGKKGKRRMVHELKGTDTSPEVKSYFLGKMPKSGWGLYAISLNKRRVYDNLRTASGKKKLYNFLTKKLLEALPVAGKHIATVNLVVDKSKDSADRKDFNAYIRANLETAFPLKTAIYISHEDSQENKGLQAVDMFCYGIQRKKAAADTAWHRQFSAYIIKHIDYLK